MSTVVHLCKIKALDTKFDYDRHGGQYASHRRTDPRIARYVHEALGPAATVLNVGAGAGSYEPTDRYILALEPSAAMRAQRPASRPPALKGVAEALPLDDQSVDVAMAMVTIHHWTDIKKGLLEMQRVARQRILIMTFDGDALDSFWNAEYFREVVEIERSRYPKIGWIVDTLGGNCTVAAIPIPLDCVDGFQEAFYGRPEAFLDREVRRAQSAWGFIPEKEQEVLVRRLADDLQSDAWDRKYGHLRSQPFFTGALRLITAIK
jgi:SAM-dependent methyltransferase